MGLFSRRREPPAPRPPVHRRLLVAAGPEAVESRLREYDGIAGPKVPEAPLTARTAGGWTSLELPPDAHPWAFHNLAMWLLDLADVVAVSGSDGTRAGYWLVNDSHSDWLSGYDDSGNPITVEVPTNEVVRGDALDHPARTLRDVLTEHGVPSALHRDGGGDPTGIVAAKLEDPGRDCNPANEQTAKSRQHLERRHTWVDAL
ncbi:MAG: hypothetical protein M5U14_02200 [Acidimicrobiia bacterium]|nr:hypothetical protein [Acidimicrobiia bacterium]